MRKVSCPIDKRAWHPSLLPGPIALVSTVGEDGAANVAPKSWLQMVSFDPPILMFAGSREGQTEANAVASGCFAVNLVDGALAERASECVRWHGAERIERSGFRLAAASAIRAPLVDDAPAHLECRLHGTNEVGSGFVVFGEIIAASMRDDLVTGEPRDRYARLDQALFLEDGLIATIDRARPTAKQPLSAHTTRWVILLQHARPELFSGELVRAHCARLEQLERQGRLELCGPFPEHRGGMVVLRGVSEDEARAIAEADPFVTSGAETYELRKLEVSCRENNHLGMGSRA